MNKLFGQIAFVLSLLCFGNTFAQEVAYSLRDGKGQPIGPRVFSYKPNGSYEYTVMNKKFVKELNDKTAVITAGGIVTVQVEGSYYHDSIGVWRTNVAVWSNTIDFPIKEVSKSKGVVKVLYVSKTPKGRLYREEFWPDGQKLLVAHETLLDDNNQVVWMAQTDKHWTLLFTRM